MVFPIWGKETCGKVLSFHPLKKKEKEKGIQGNNLIVPGREGGRMEMDEGWEGHMVLGKYKEKNKNNAQALESCPVALKHTAQLYSLALGSRRC